MKYNSTSVDHPIEVAKEHEIQRFDGGEGGHWRDSFTCAHSPIEEVRGHDTNRLVSVESFSKEVKEEEIERLKTREADDIYQHEF